MKKSIIKALSVVLVLVLIVSCVPMVFAAEVAHICDYAVTTYFKYVWVNNSQHEYREYHQHTCSCGDTYLEHHVVSTSNHSALPGSGVNLGSYFGDNGETITTYRYTCKACGGTYTQTTTSP